MTVVTRPPTVRTRVDARRAAVAGTLAAAVALSVSVLVDAFVRSVPSLVAVVGQAVIRHTPGFLSRGATETVGTADKPLLLALIVALALGIGARVGVAASRRRPTGDVALAAFGLFAVVCAASLPDVSVGATLASAALAATAGALTLRRLLAATSSSPPAPALATGSLPAELDASQAGAAPILPVSPAPPTLPVDATGAPPDVRDEPALTIGDSVPDETGPGPTAYPGERHVSRRRFIVAGSTAAGGAAAVLTGAWGLRRSLGGSSPQASVVLPGAAGGPPALGAASDGFHEVDGLSPLVTPNRKFYRIDEALMVPSVNLDSWRLRVTGMVDSPFELSYDDLLALPLVERHITLSCVSNQVGGPLVGTAKWLGVRLVDLLSRAGVHPGASQLVGRSVDGFTVGFPVEVATDGRDALVAVGMNGEPLPSWHGFPARLVVPGLYGYVSATKWLEEIELTTFDAFDPYWVERNWSRKGPVKVQSRVDVPRDRSWVAAGALTVAGVAWAPHRGVGRVEVQVDDGPWHEAALGPALGDDAWRQWSLPWDATPGEHVIAVRATTGDGEVQTPTNRPVFPDGATGHHRVTVQVTP
ncbi:MAG TPA: molybdopterin-dependent oxidoreductase [Acidimicrobiales bacterium]|nr:molybdopterin-dependent oxidoreductase [Acidimicrobiales bacterium]